MKGEGGFELGRTGTPVEKRGTWLLSGLSPTGTGPRSAWKNRNRASHRRAGRRAQGSGEEGAEQQNPDEHSRLSSQVPGGVKRWAGPQEYQGLICPRLLWLANRPFPALFLLITAPPTAGRERTSYREVWQGGNQCSLGGLCSMISLNWKFFSFWYKTQKSWDDRTCSAEKKNLLHTGKSKKHVTSPKSSRWAPERYLQEDTWGGIWCDLWSSLQWPGAVLSKQLWFWNEHPLYLMILIPSFLWSML